MEAEGWFEFVDWGQEFAGWRGDFVGGEPGEGDFDCFSERALGEVDLELVLGLDSPALGAELGVRDLVLGEGEDAAMFAGSSFLGEQVRARVVRIRMAFFILGLLGLGITYPLERDFRGRSWVNLFFWVLGVLHVLALSGVFPYF